MLNETIIRRRAKKLGKASQNATEKINRRIQDSEGFIKYIKFLLKAFVLIFFGFIIIFPFYFMLARALMTYGESVDPTSPIAPDIPQWNNFILAFKQGYWKSLLFSSLVVIFTILFKVVICMLLGYAFGNYKFRFKNTIWWLLMLSMALPEVALLSGQFKQVVNLGWDEGVGLMFGLIAPFVASVFTGYMFRSAFESIPSSIKEAAMVDGITGTNYFFKIAVPMVASTTWTVVILTMFASWNSYMWPSLILQDSPIKTLPLWLFTVGIPDDGSNIMQPQIQMAGAILTIIPTFLIYFFFRTKINNATSNGGSGNKG